jgi:hypothetical protein
LLAEAAADPAIMQLLKSRGMSLESERFDFSVRANDGITFMGDTRQVRVSFVLILC